MSDLQIWMARRKLKVNDGKTEIVVIRGNLRNVSVANFGEMSFDDTPVIPCESAKNLGVVLGSSLSFRSHIDSIVKTCNFHICNLYMIKDFVNRKNLVTLVHSLIISKVDYCRLVASNGKSELIILPLALMTSLSRYKLSCLIVVFTSRFTFTILLVRCA